MAVTLEIGVCDLLTELLTDALILFGTLESAGTITAGTLQAIFHGLNYFQLALGGRMQILRGPGISPEHIVRETKIRTIKLLILKRDKAFFLAFPKKLWNMCQFFV